MQIRRHESDKHKPNKSQLENSNQYFNVILRIRPIIPNDYVELTLPKEKDPCIWKQSDKKIILKRDEHDCSYEMNFDKILDEKTTQEELYDSFAKDLVNDVTQGYNSTIMTYGQTGSGKTYTIFGEEDNDASQGLVQRAIRDLFNHKEKNPDKRSIKIHISFFQVYLNQICDLLEKEEDDEDDENDKNKEYKKHAKIKMQIKEGTHPRDLLISPYQPDFQTSNKQQSNKVHAKLKLHMGKDSAYIIDLQKREVRSEQDFYDLIEAGRNERVTDKTSMNETSSRSHAILQILFEQAWYEPQEGESNPNLKKRHMLQGLLTIIDLAGSENVSRTGSEGIKQDEAKEINKSIYALGRVIEALANNSPHVPYRDSNLTGLLADCLGGNSKTAICACVSPCKGNFEETFSTLKFASRANTIKTAAKRNEKIDTRKMEKDNEMNDFSNIKHMDGRIKDYRKQFNDKSKNVKRIMNDMKVNFNGEKGKVYHNISTARGGRNSSDGDRNINSNGNMGQKEDYVGINKKFVSNIIHLQEELGKLIMRNLALEEENSLLREQLYNHGNYNNY